MRWGDGVARAVALLAWVRASAADEGVLRLPLVHTSERAPAHLVERHLRRRRLGEHTPADSGPVNGVALHAALHGNLKLGYFSTIVGFGTPAQHFELIVDTGSGITAVPCAGCTQCGNHRKFDASASSSAIVCKGTSCAFSIAYQEGSTYRGTYVDDMLSVGSASACAALPYRFGCSNVETGLFRSQEADGILGLAPGTGTRRTVQDALVGSKIVRDVFSLCIAPQSAGGHGFLEFGESARARAATSGRTASAPITSSRSYLISVSAIRLGEGSASLGVPESVLLDSGTTFVYAGSRIFAPLFRAVSAVRLAACGLVSAKPPRGGEICAGPGGAAFGPPMSDRLDRCFPELLFDMPDGSVRASPSSYWYAEGKGGEREGVWCMGIFKNHNQQLVLGASVLQDHLVTVDREAKRVRFSPHRCADGAAPRVPTNRTNQTGALVGAVASGSAADAAVVTVPGSVAPCVPPPERLVKLKPPPGGAMRPAPASSAGVGSSASFLPFGGVHAVGRPPWRTSWFGSLHWPGGRWWQLYAAVTAVCAFVLFAACLVFGCAGGSADACCAAVDESWGEDVAEVELEIQTALTERAIARAVAHRARGCTGGEGGAAPPPIGACALSDGDFELALGQRARRLSGCGRNGRRSGAPAQTSELLDTEDDDADGRLPSPDRCFAVPSIVSLASAGEAATAERRALLGGRRY